jgi:hypothetical protein
VLYFKFWFRADDTLRCRQRFFKPNFDYKKILFLILTQRNKKKNMSNNSQKQNQLLALSTWACLCTLRLIIALRLPVYGSRAFSVSTPIAYFIFLKKHLSNHFSFWKNQYLGRFIRDIPIRGSG